MERLLAQVWWRNIILRTVLFYGTVGALAFLLQQRVPTTWEALRGESLTDLVRAAATPAQGVAIRGPGPLVTAIAMLTAFLTALPVAWIYTLTRRRKGYQQSIVQTYVILPVIVAGIVVLVKYSVALAFALGGIVAAVRFRTSLDDSKDATGIFVVTALGMAAAVNPSVAWVISVAFNLLMLLLWYTDFGRPSALEGRMAEKRLKQALSVANRTGLFVARLDEEVLKSLAPEQLEALADRAWRRRRKATADSDLEDAPEEPAAFDHLMRLHVDVPELARATAEGRFSGLLARWKFMGTARDGDRRVLEYGVTFADTVTKGVVNDELRGLPDHLVRKVEFR
jgi:hypothetical protein